MRFPVGPVTLQLGTWGNSSNYPIQRMQPGHAFSSAEKKRETFPSVKCLSNTLTRSVLSAGSGGTELSRIFRRVPSPWTSSISTPFSSLFSTAAYFCLDHLPLSFCPCGFVLDKDEATGSVEKSLVSSSPDETVDIRLEARQILAWVSL